MLLIGSARTSHAPSNGTRRRRLSSIPWAHSDRELVEYAIPASSRVAVSCISCPETAAPARHAAWFNAADAGAFRVHHYLETDERVPIPVKKSRSGLRCRLTVPLGSVRGRSSSLIRGVAPASIL